MNEKNVFNFLEVGDADSRIVDGTAEKLRKEYVEYLVKLGRGNEKNIYWWVLNSISRNTLISRLFKDICYLVMLKNKFDKGQTFDIIIVDSPSLRKTLWEFKIENKYDFRISYKGKSLLKLHMSRFYSYLKVAFNFFLRWFFGWASKGFKKDSKIYDDIIMLDTFIYKDSFRNNSFNDRYYPTLLEYFKQGERKYIYYLPTYYGIWNYRKLFKNLRKSEKKFLLKEDYLKLKDYFYALSLPFRTRMVRAKEKFYGFDISHLLKEEVLNDRVSNSSMNGMLNYRFTERLKGKGLKIKMVINWFENQSIDHGLNIGFREYYREADLIGYLGFPPQNNYLSLYPTEQERAYKIIPEEIRVIGRGYVDIVKQFCPKLSVSVAPAFRHVKVWNKREIYPDKKKFVVLIALPILTGESDELIGIVLDSAKSNGIANCFFQIKPHPTHDLNVLKSKWNRKLTPDFSFISGDFNSCVENADVLVSCTSSACLETIAKGIPVIVIASRSGLTQLVIPEEIKQNIWKLCYTVEDVKKAILYYAGRGKDVKKQYGKIGSKVRERFFEPVNRESVRNFLGFK